MYKTKEKKKMSHKVQILILDRELWQVLWFVTKISSAFSANCGRDVSMIPAKNSSIDPGRLGDSQVSSASDNEFSIT